VAIYHVLRGSRIPGVIPKNDGFPVIIIVGIQKISG